MTLTHNVGRRLCDAQNLVKTNHMYLNYTLVTSNARPMVYSNGYKLYVGFN
jgi:hypothetical protein